MTKRFYSKEEIAAAVRVNESFAGVLRTLGARQAGGSSAWIKTRAINEGIDFSHFTGQAHNKGRTSPKKKTPEQILIRLPEGSHRPKHEQLKRAMIESGVEYICSIDGCPNPEPIWNGKPITLDVDHIDKNWLNNELNNLRFACPNCHSQL